MSIKKGAQRCDDAGLYPQSMMPRFNVRYRSTEATTPNMEDDISLTSMFQEISSIYRMYTGCFPLYLQACKFVSEETSSTRLTPLLAR